MLGMNRRPLVKSFSIKLFDWRMKMLAPRLVFTNPNRSAIFTALIQQTIFKFKSFKPNAMMIEYEVALLEKAIGFRRLSQNVPPSSLLQLIHFCQSHWCRTKKREKLSKISSAKLRVDNERSPAQVQQPAESRL